MALAAPSAVATTAEAGPTAPTSSVKSQTKQLLKDIAGRDKRLARLSTRNAVQRLADDTELALVANVTEARAALAVLASAVEATDSTVDTRALRNELRETAALEITATSTKADIRAVRAHVQAAQAELETETEAVTG